MIYLYLLWFSNQLITVGAPPCTGWWTYLLSLRPGQRDMGFLKWADRSILLLKAWSDTSLLAFLVATRMRGETSKMQRRGHTLYILEMSVWNGSWRALATGWSPHSTTASGVNGSYVSNKALDYGKLFNDCCNFNRQTIIYGDGNMHCHCMPWKPFSEHMEWQGRPSRISLDPREPSKVLPPPRSTRLPHPPEQLTPAGWSWNILQSGAP